jgi:hypothetical protein
LRGNFSAGTLITAPIIRALGIKPLPRPARPVRRGAGGCDFWSDPALRADEAEIFWLPELNASAVILTASPVDAKTLKFEPSDWTGLLARRAADDGEHLIVKAGGEENQLWLPDPPAEGSPVAAVIPLDDLTLHRADAALRFWRHMAGARIRAGPTRRQDQPRAVRALQALDGHLNGAAYRAIAEILFGPARLSAEPWKTASVRDATIRLVRSGVAFMRGGYRDLLRRPKLD